jgi:glycosyltransferase involved in cell wall biosynthesis
VLAGLDVVAVTSTSEALPLCLLEAMATGLPVVTTDVGDASRVVSDEVTGFVVAGGDEHALVDRLERLAGDPSLRGRLGAAGRERLVERYSVGAMVDAYERLFARLLDGGAPR